MGLEMTAREEVVIGAATGVVVLGMVITRRREFTFSWKGTGLGVLMLQCYLV